MVDDSAVKEHLLALLQDYGDFNDKLIDVRPVPCAVEFAKQVSKGYPCVYTAFERSHSANSSVPNFDKSLTSFPAASWNKQDLIQLLEDAKLEVAVTPDGRADDLKHVPGHAEPVFVSPANIEMSIVELLGKLDETDHNNHEQSPVHYLQSQNSNLTTTELERLRKEVPENFLFAEPVLGEPEAVNIWIGDERSVTSTHRDPYENLYIVLKGSKTFTLYPPVDELTLPTKNVLVGKYVYDRDRGHFNVVMETETIEGELVRIPWIDLTPNEPREEVIARYALYEHSSPRVVVVKEGQMLYLPSGWFHMVQQDCGRWKDGSRAPCIAVNYWYDMEYGGEKHVMRQLLTKLSSELHRPQITTPN